MLELKYGLRTAPPSINMVVGFNGELLSDLRDSDFVYDTPTFAESEVLKRYGASILPYNSFDDTAPLSPVLRPTLSLGAAVPSSTSLTVPVPSVTEVGDLMLAAIVYIGSSTSGTTAFTAPAGWTLVSNQTMGALATGRLVIWHRTAGSSEPANYTWTAGPASNQHLGSMMALDAALLTTPTGSSTSGTAVTAHDTPAITTLGYKEVVLRFVGAIGTGGWTWNNPSVVGELVDYSSGQGQLLIGGSQYRNAGAVPLQTATAANANNYAGTTLLIRGG